MEFVKNLHHESDSDSESDIEIEIELVEDEADDQFIELIECFDQHKLNHIIQNKRTFMKQMRKSCFENDHNPFAIMEKYLAKSRNGQIAVRYKQNKSKGRFFAVGGLSMQSLPREIRHTIQKNYIDVDVVNAHPVILSFLAKQRKLKTKYLDKYNSERDELLETLQVDRDTAKTAVLSLMNGGNKAYKALEVKPKWIIKLKKEIDAIHNQFSLDPGFEAHKRKRESEGVKFNHKGSYMNILLCDYENQILQVLYKHFGSPKNCVLCFDGLMIESGESEEIDLAGAEAAVFESLGIQIKLKVKQFDEGFEIDEDITPYEDKVWYFHHMRDFCKQAPNINIDTLKEWMTDSCIIAIQRGRSMLFTKNLELDGSISYEPQDGLALPNFSWTACSEDGKKRKYSLNSVFDQIKWQNSYDYFNFIPYLTIAQKQSISPRLFNTFDGFRWRYEKKTYPLDNKGLPIPPASIKPWIDHLSTTLIKQGQGPSTLPHTIIQWYAHIFQNPTIKPWALVFMSEEGIGKGLWQTFFEQVLTKALSATFTSWDQICGSFNGQMAGKLLYTLNEATNYPTNTQKELMKSMIKDTQLSVNRKFVNQYDIDNYARVQITTNNRRPVAIDYDDRRYCCIESDNRVRGDKEYFKPLIDSRFDEKTQHDMFDYLTNYPLDGFDSEKPPMTKWKRELVGQNLSSAYEFVKDVCEGVVRDYVWDEDEDKQDQTMRVKATKLYEDYKTWCSENGEHKTGSNRQFYAELKKIAVEKKQMRIDGSNTKGFKLVKTDLQVALDKLLCK